MMQFLKEDGIKNQMFTLYPIPFFIYQKEQ